MTLAEAIKKAIGSRQYRLVAEKVGVSAPAISYLVNGKRTPQLATLIKLAEVCEVKASTILKWAGL